MILKSLLFIAVFIVFWLFYPLTRSRATNFVTAPIVDFILRILFATLFGYLAVTFVF